jgi:L-threonylcarbamoyladenylate synthase
MPDCSNSTGVTDAENLTVAASVLLHGGLVVYPTETVYGLGVDASNPTALHRLAEVKGRAEGKPISVLIAEAAMLGDLVSDISPAAAVLMRHFWPGPLTIVLTARPGLSEVLTAGTGTIGIRLSSHPTATALVRACGRPITASSANPAGMPPPHEVEAAKRYFGTQVDAYVDGGVLHGVPPSTVVDARGRVAIVRAGAVAPEAVYAALAKAG